MNTNNNQSYVTSQSSGLTFVSMLYITLILISITFGSRIIETRWGMVSIGSITAPFWFVLCDIITEVYGYKTSIRIFWITMVCELIFVIVSYLVLNIHSVNATLREGEKAYNVVFGYLLRIYFVQMVSTVVACYLNSYLISRSKIIFYGRYFGLRSIVSSGLGEILFSILSLTFIMMGRVNFSVLVNLILMSCLLKITISCFCSIPAIYTAGYLKRLDKIDIYDSFKINTCKVT